MQVTARALPFINRRKTLDFTQPTQPIAYEIAIGDVSHRYPTEDITCAFVRDVVFARQAYAKRYGLAFGDTFARKVREA